MDEFGKAVRKLSEKLARKSALIKKWEEGAKALRALDTPEQRTDRKQREEEAHDRRRTEEIKEAQGRARRRTKEADREAAQTKLRAESLYLFIVLTIIGIFVVIFLIRWFCALFKN